VNLSGICGDAIAPGLPSFRALAMPFIELAERPTRARAENLVAVAFWLSDLHGWLTNALVEGV